jgi:plastocyanin
MSQRARQQHRRVASRRRALALTVLTLLVAGALLALGTRLGSDDAGSSGSEPVSVSMTEFAFAPDPIVLARGDARLSVVNDGDQVHDILIGELGKGTPNLAPGESMTLDLSDQPAGTYRVICDLPGHAEAGMVTELVLG